MPAASRFLTDASPTAASNISGGTSRTPAAWVTLTMITSQNTHGRPRMARIPSASRLLATFVLDSVQEQTRGRAPDGAADMAARLRDFPNLARIAPTFGRMSSDALFELGVEIILDGLTHRPRR